MPGKIFEYESQFWPDTCGCVFARDESPDKRGTDAVLLSAQYIYQCDEHKNAGSSAVDAHRHNFSIGCVLRGVAEQHGINDQALEIAYSPKTGKVCFRHPQSDAKIFLAVASALVAHPLVNLMLADQPTHDMVFAELDALVPKVRVAFWDFGVGGKLSVRPKT